MDRSLGTVAPAFRDFDIDDSSRTTNVAGPGGARESESIPMVEFCPPSKATPEIDGELRVKKTGQHQQQAALQTQSSTETSGVGDCFHLCRMDTLSSTGTSAYTDTVSSPTAGVQSPNSISNVDIERDESTARRQQPIASGSGNGSSEGCRPICSRPSPTPSAKNKSCSHLNVDRGSQPYTRVKQSHAGSKQSNSGSKAPRKVSIEHRQMSDSNENRRKLSEVCDDDDDDDDEDDFKSSNSGDIPIRRSRSNLTAVTGVSRSLSGGDVATMDGCFLGRNTQSAWLRWSHERRASYKRRVEFMEQRQSEMQRARMSSPVRKARKESVRFIAPSKSDFHVSDDQDHEESHLFDGGTGIVAGGLAAFPFDIPPTMAKLSHRQQAKVEAAKLSLAQWNALVAFWGHCVFAKFRLFGILFNIGSLVVGGMGLADEEWARTTNESVHLSNETMLTLWRICLPLKINCTNIDHDNWQMAVIGLLLFSNAFGAMALVLSICGLFTSSLPKKVYFYHSAGEVNFVCCLSSCVALVMYPVAMEYERHLVIDTLGFGYLLVCGSSGGFLVAAFCMCLDDVVQTMAKGLCKRPSDDSTRRPHVQRFFFSDQR